MEAGELKVKLVEQGPSVLLYLLFALVLNWGALRLGFYRSFLADAKKSSITFIQVLIVFVVYFGMQLLGFLFEFSPIHFQSAPIASQFFIFSLSSVLIILYSHHLEKKPGSVIWKDRKHCASLSIPFDIGMGFLAFILSFPIYSFIGNSIDLVISFLGIEEIPQMQVEMFKKSMSNPLWFSLTLITVAIIAPIIEELLFRGFLQTWLKKYLGPKAAILLASLFFAATHYSKEQSISNISILASLFTLSIFLGYIYERQRSLYAPIALHMGVNITSSIWIFFSSST